MKWWWWWWTSASRESAREFSFRSVQLDRLRGTNAIRSGIFLFYKQFCAQPEWAKAAFAAVLCASVTIRQRRRSSLFVLCTVRAHILSNICCRYAHRQNICGDRFALFEAARSHRAAVSLGNITSIATAKHVSFEKKITLSRKSCLSLFEKKKKLKYILCFIKTSFL